MDQQASEPSSSGVDSRVKSAATGRSATGKRRRTKDTTDEPPPLVLLVGAFTESEEELEEEEVDQESQEDPDDREQKLKKRLHAALKKVYATITADSAASSLTHISLVETTLIYPRQHIHPTAASTVWTLLIRTITSYASYNEARCTSGQIAKRRRSSACEVD
eukprot:1182569-Prorocentrum_minimum.AAC.3